MSSHYFLICIGSAGDHFPYLAIGKELKQRGHRVTCAINPYFRKHFESAGLAWVGLSTEAEYLEAVNDEASWSPVRGPQLLMTRHFGPLVRPTYELVQQQDLTQTTVVAPPFAYGARIAQERLGAKLVTLHLQPSGFWSVENPGIFSGIGDISLMPRFMRKAFFDSFDAFVIGSLLGKFVNGFRQDVGLASINNYMRWCQSPLRTLGLFPNWFGPPASDWPSFARVTGFVKYDGAADDFSHELQRFLEAGEPPLVFTPGTAMGSAEAFFKEAAKATRLLGRRAVFLSSHMSGKLPDTLFDSNVQLFAYAPFSTLLPRAAVFVHHGGIGTCAQGLAAGVPQLVRPFGFDQPDNAARLVRLEVAREITAKRFRAERIAQELDFLLSSPKVKESCQKWAQQVDFAAGLQQTCNEITSV